MALFNFSKTERSSRRVHVILALAVAAVVTVSVDTSMADITETIKLIPGDGNPLDKFGSSVSISEDYAIVGAPNDDEGIITNSGCAYVFERTNGTWSEKAKLLAPDRSHHDAFGYSVSISGNYAIVGKPFDDHTGSNYGSAYIFQRIGSTWSQVAKLVALKGENVSDGGPNDYFGTSVSINGDYAVVGAPNDDDNGSDSGSAYIYQRIGSTWSQVGKLLAPDGASGDLFGYAVAICGDDAVVGAPRYDYDTDTDAGAMYIFKRSEDTWTTLGASIDPAGESGDEFGWSVAIDGHFALAGAQKHDAGAGLSDAGSARLFEEVSDTGVWVTLSYHLLVPSDREASDNFGYSVSISGDHTVVGSLKYINGTGTVYVFKESTTDDNWPQLKKLIASDAPWQFGISVSISDRYAIVGASESAYIYDMLSDPGPSTSGAMPWVPLLLLDD